MPLLYFPYSEESAISRCSRYPECRILPGADAFPPEVPVSPKNKTKAETKTETESQTVTVEEESKADEKGGSDDNK